MKKTCFYLFLPLLSMAQKNETPLINQYLDAETAIHHFNGNVLIAKAGSIIFERSIGVRNYATNEPLDNQSVFELASVSKQYTAMGILLLKEKGKLALSDSLRKFFPELPYSSITIRHLLTHTSGLPAYEEGMEKKWDHKNIASNADVIHFLAQEKPSVHFKPGAKWEYSNTGFVLLASIIEKVSGQTFKAYMNDQIFKPLNMEHSRVYNTRRSTKEVIPDYAYGYVYSDSLKKYLLPDELPDYDFVIYLDSIQGDGTINSTAEDMLKWDRALKNNTLLSKQTQQEMLSAQAIIDTASGKSYGYGVFTGKNEIGSYVQHSGGWPGYRTMLIRYPDDDLTIIVLSNNESNSMMIAGSLAYLVTGKPIVMPYHHKQATINKKLLNRYTGTYEVPGSGKLNVVNKDGVLCLNDNGKNELKLKPESDVKFFCEGEVDLQLEFEVNKTGNLLNAFFIINGMKKEMQKVK